MEIPAGSEILVNYANDYFEPEGEEPSPTSGTEQGSVELTGDGLIPGESMRNASERSPVSIKMAVFGTFQNVAVQNVAPPSLNNCTLKL